MVQTRAQERGAPLKKPGAYDTDAYYNEIDQGFGDVGVDQVQAEVVTRVPHANTHMLTLSAAHAHAFASILMSGAT